MTLKSMWWKTSSGVLVFVKGAGIKYESKKKDKEYCSSSLEALMKKFCKKRCIMERTLMHPFVQKIFIRASTDKEWFFIFKWSTHNWGVEELYDNYKLKKFQWIKSLKNEAEDREIKTLKLPEKMLWHLGDPFKISVPRFIQQHYINSIQRFGDNVLKFSKHHFKVITSMFGYSNFLLDTWMSVIAMYIIWNNHSQIQNKLLFSTVYNMLLQSFQSIIFHI